MRPKLQIVVFTLLTVCTLQAQTHKLTSFQEVFASLKSGNTVTSVIYYRKCILISDSTSSASPDAIGGMVISPWEYFAPKAVHNPLAFFSSSENVLISHPRYGYVYNYVKLKAFENDSIDIAVRYLNPTTFEVLMDERFTGKINTGDSVNGVFFYDKQ